MRKSISSSPFEQFPPILGVEQLSLLINKAPATIFADRCRAPHKIPPAFMPPGSKQPLWILSDVVEWLRKHPEQPEARTREFQAAYVGRGRPSKIEAVAARCAGLSVSAYRKQQRENVTLQA